MILEIIVENDRTVINGLYGSEIGMWRCGEENGYEMVLGTVNNWTNYMERIWWEVMKIYGGVKNCFEERRFEIFLALFFLEYCFYFIQKIQNIKL